MLSSEVLEHLYSVPILYPMRTRDAANEPPWLNRVGSGNAVRMQTAARLRRRLQRNEREPGMLRRLFCEADKFLRGT